MRFLAPFLALACLALPAAAAAEVVGRQTPAESITETRIRALPPEQQPPWIPYLQRSRALMAQDKAALAAERGGGPVPPMVEKGPSGGGGMPLDQPAAWYGTAEARRVADNIVSFQTPAGGWGKNQERNAPPRLRGQAYTAADVPWAARDIAGDPNWAFVGTIDNNATTQELRFLARAQRQLPGADGNGYRASFLKGVRYLLAAQFPNGGWPQVFPLMGGYHDAITFNDGAIPEVLDVLSLVAGRQGDYAFVPERLAGRAKASAERGLARVLASQVVVDGRRAVWGQQHDALILAPVGARAWEPGSLATEESAGVLVWLMQSAPPTPEVSAAVEAGVKWLRERAMYDVEWPREPPPEGKLLIRKPGAGPLWARMYDIRTGKPVFGDLDRNIHDNVEALTPEHRNGYGWFSTAPAKALAAHEAWSARRKGAD